MLFLQQFFSFYFSLPSWIPNGLFILDLPIHTIYILFFYYSQCEDVNFMIFHPYRHSRPRLLFFSNIQFLHAFNLPSYAYDQLCCVCTNKVGIYCVILLKNSNLIWLCCRSLLHQKIVFPSFTRLVTYMDVLLSFTQWIRKFDVKLGQSEKIFTDLLDWFTKILFVKGWNLRSFVGDVCNI